MKIAIASIGRFHLFDLARQVMALRQEIELYTGYPAFKVDRDLRPVVRTRPGWTVACRIRHVLGPAPATTWWEDHALRDFGHWLARILGEVDLLDALAGTGLEAGRLLRRRGRPWICNQGSSHILRQKELLEAEHQRWGLQAPFFSAEGIERCLAEYAEADAIVVPSEFARRSFLERGVSEARIFKCPYGVDLSLFGPRPSSEPGRRFRAVAVGAIGLRKGTGYFLEALRPLTSRGHAETWLIGPMTPEGRRLTRPFVGEYRYQGVVPRSGLAGLLSRCDVLVLPSVEDGFGLVMAQAMACGLPVIATRNTGAEDLFTDGREGFIVPVADPDAIQEKVQWMIENSALRREMGRAAQQRVRELGGWEVYGRRCLSMYEQLIRTASS